MKDFNLVEPPRKWGQPVLNDGTRCLRPSTLSKVTDDQRPLMKWHSRLAVHGTATSEDLTAEAATTPLEDKRALDRIVEAALERSKSSAGASLGTAIHAATELIDYGKDTSHVPAKALADAQAYRDEVDRIGVTPRAAELFVVCDELQAAGTCDRVIEDGEGRFAIGDLKTTGDVAYDVAKYSALAWSIQLAIYAHSVPYCAERGRLTWEELGLKPPSTETGVVFHITRGKATCRALLVDLEAGWKYAQLARDVYWARKAGKSLATVWQ